MADDEAGPVQVEIHGRKVTVSGEVARAIIYLATYAEFFNDKRTSGSFLLIAKDGHLHLKSTIAD